MDYSPNRSVVLLRLGKLVDVPPSEITGEMIGHKALGLLCLPSCWVPQFFVVSLEFAAALTNGDSALAQSNLENALARIGLDKYRQFMVRSSAVDETIEERGSLVSKEATKEALKSVIQECVAETKFLGKTIHWIVQPLIAVQLKGHVSNEARISQAKRDWVFEVEMGTDGQPQGGPVAVAIRKWRHGEAKEPQALICTSSVLIDKVLHAPARWASDKKLRLHFEWVWDGNSVWLVQGDLCVTTEGIDPRSVLPAHVAQVDAHGLTLFRTAGTTDFGKYRKLANAKMYAGLGYSLPTFYVLDSREAISQLISGAASDGLRKDIAALTTHPLVVRTDGEGIPSELRQMLPRSDELRSSDAAMAWFRQDLLKKLKPLADHSEKIVFICHHFLPAEASAWCMAEPAKRMVRIEALWGIPEGMYWYPHDIFEVDTLEADIKKAAARRELFQCTRRIRYKEWFVAPDGDGAWLANRTNESSRWSPTISKKSWFSEIALISRQIADQVGHPVNVMWFLGVHKEALQHRILPWYHEKCELNRSLLRSAPRFKRSDSTIFELRTLAEWERLKLLPSQERQVIKRIRVSPREPALIRSQEFLAELSAFAKDNDAVVVLQGGVLSHAYYILQKAGCKVEIADLYGVKDEPSVFNKMVRDKIPESIEKNGERVIQVQLKGDELIAALKAKLVEEATEVFDAHSTAETIEELADVLEVVYALAERLGSSIRQVQESRKRKKARRGGFEDGKVLIETANPQSLTPEPNQVAVAGTSHESQLPLNLHDPVKLVPTVATLEQEVLLHQDEIERHGARERLLEIDLPLVSRSPIQRTTEFRITTHSDWGELSIPLIGQWSVTRKNGELRVRLLVRPQAVQSELDLSGGEKMDGSPSD